MQYIKRFAPPIVGGLVLAITLLVGIQVTQWARGVSEFMVRQASTNAQLVGAWNQAFAPKTAPAAAE